MNAFGVDHEVAKSFDKDLKSLTPEQRGHAAAYSVAGLGGAAGMVVGGPKLDSALGHMRMARMHEQNAKNLGTVAGRYAKTGSWKNAVPLARAARNHETVGYAHELVARRKGKQALALAGGGTALAVGSNIAQHVYVKRTAKANRNQKIGKAMTNAFGVEHEISKADAPVFMALKRINKLKVKGVPKGGGKNELGRRLENAKSWQSVVDETNRLRSARNASGVAKNAFGVEKAFNPMKAMDGTFDMARAGKQAMGGLKSMVTGGGAKLQAAGNKVNDAGTKNFLNAASSGNSKMKTPKMVGALAQGAMGAGMSAAGAHPAKTLAVGGAVGGATAGGFMAGRHNPSQKASRKTLFGKRDFSAQTREKLADKGHAMPDGSFPINSAEDLTNAIRLAGRSKNPGAARAFIKRRAKAMGLEDRIPEGWESGADDDHDADDVAKSAFGVTDSRIAKYSQEEKAQHVAGTYLVPGVYGAVKGKKGKKLRAAGTEMGAMTAGAVGGSAAGMGMSALRGGRMGIPEKATAAGLGITAAALGARHNEKRRNYKES